MGSCCLKKILTLTIWFYLILSIIYKCWKNSNVYTSTNLMTFGNIQGSDSSSSTGLTIVLDPKTALTFDYLTDVVHLVVKEAVIFM
jgi:hypothetical protein